MVGDVEVVDDGSLERAREGPMSSGADVPFSLCERTVGVSVGRMIADPH
jgi:hypothetical protein